MGTSSERTRLKKLLSAFLSNCHISPDMTAAWLTSLGWTEAPENCFGLYCRTFELQGRQMAVPVMDNYSDYSRRLVEMLEEIADVEQGFAIDYYRAMTIYVIHALKMVEISKSKGGN